jgi:hypothetical protein
MPFGLWSSLITWTVTVPDPTVEKIRPNMPIRMIGKKRVKNRATGLRKYVRETILKSAATWPSFTGTPPP